VTLPLLEIQKWQNNTQKPRVPSRRFARFSLIGAQQKYWEGYQRTRSSLILSMGSHIAVGGTSTTSLSYVLCGFLNW